MKRTDLVDLGRFYARSLRREASSRRKRYPAQAEQLDRWAVAVEAQVETVRCGPLFSGDQA